jgi:hypothetical protein
LGNLRLPSVAGVKRALIEYPVEIEIEVEVDVGHRRQHNNPVPRVPFTNAD